MSNITLTQYSIRQPGMFNAGTFRANNSADAINQAIKTSGIADVSKLFKCEVSAHVHIIARHNRPYDLYGFRVIYLKVNKFKSLG